MTIASFSSFLGSLWFAGLLGVAGYLAGNVFPLSKVSELFKK